jgi:hypothetical protein
MRLLSSLVGSELPKLMARVQNTIPFFSDLGWRPNTGKVVGNFSFKKKKGLVASQRKNGTHPKENN